MPCQELEEEEGNEGSAVVGNLGSVDGGSPEEMVMRQEEEGRMAEFKEDKTREITMTEVNGEMMKKKCFVLRNRYDSVWEKI